MVTNFRKELIVYYRSLIEQYPDTIQYRNDLEFFESGEERTKLYPLGLFFMDLIKKMEFYLTDDSIMSSVRRGYDCAVRNYEYESVLYPHDIIESKTIRLTKKTRAKLGKNLAKFRIHKTPLGKEYVSIYKLWVDASAEEMEVEYTTYNEIFFCQYLLNRDIVTEELKGFRLRKTEDKEFRRGSIIFEPCKRYSMFSLSLLYNEDEYIQVGDFDLKQLKRILNTINSNELWDASYRTLEKNNALKGMIDF